MSNGHSVFVRVPQRVVRGTLGTLSACALAVTCAAGAQASVSNPDDSPEPSPLSPGHFLYPTPGQPIDRFESTEESSDASVTTARKGSDDVRLATFHAGLEDDSLDDFITSLREGLEKARTIAQTVQINSPDVLVLTGVSADQENQVAEILRDDYFAVGQNGEEAIEFPHIYTAQTNSGLDSGADLNRDNIIGGPGDAIGFGEYLGHLGVIVFSKYPVKEDQVRTFQDFLWNDMPDNSMKAEQYSKLEKSILRLRTGTLWDVPLEVGEDKEFHVIATSVSTPEDQDDFDVNRSNDERRMISDYVNDEGWYLYDDEGERGGLPGGSDYVLMGEPVSSFALRKEEEDLQEVIDSYNVQDPKPTAVTDRGLDGRASADSGSDELATRVTEGGEDVRRSFALLSSTLDASQSGVFWPGEGEFGYSLVDPGAITLVEDRLVWVDVNRP